MVKRIFLSHSSSDKDWCRQLATDLRSKGLSVWFDEWELDVGDSLIEKISVGIGSSGYLAVVLSRASVASEWVRKELNVAIAKQIEAKRVFVIPILKEDCDIPLMLRDLFYADFRRSYSDGLQLLLQRLNRDENGFPRDSPCSGEFKSPNNDDLRIVDIAINEPIYNHPELDFRADGDTHWDFEGAIHLDPDAFMTYPNWFPVLDIKLRNVGNSVAFLKRCEFHIARVARFRNPHLTQRHQVPVSYNYDISLNPNLEGHIVSVALSEALKPDDVDRFWLTVGQTGADPDSPVWYYFRLVLKYNENDSSCSSDPILLTIPSDQRTMGESGTSGFSNSVVATNVALFEEFSQLEGLKSPTIMQLVTRRNRA